VVPIIKYYWPAILWALFIFALCTIKLGGVENAPMFFPGFDKLVHCGFFFVLVIFYCNGVIRQHNYTVLPFKYIVMIFIVAVAYGGSIELLQWKIFTWRDGDWNDLFADTVGAGMGIFAVLVTAAGINYGKK
jgi:VanZ family protein